VGAVAVGDTELRKPPHTDHPPATLLPPFSAAAFRFGHSQIRPSYRLNQNLSPLPKGLSWNEPLGALIVIAGIAVSQGRLKTLRHRRTSASEAAT